MVCAEANWCDFISFDPRVAEEYQVFVFKLQLDQSEADYMVKKIETAVKYLKELKEKIENAKLIKG
jgi:hypothetical protein